MTSSRSRIPLALAALALAASGCASTGSDSAGSDDSSTSSGASGSSSPSGSASASSAPTYDKAALDAGAAWLGSQVNAGVVHNDQYDTDDYGLSVDVALALHDADQQSATVQAVSDMLTGHVKDYTSPGYGTITSAGSTAKTVVLAEALGADPSSYGGNDLVAQLEKTVADDGPAKGRLQDVLDPKEKAAADYANVVGQAYAVQALRGAKSDEAGAATDYLLAQQCKAGWFRLDFTKDTKAKDQSCGADTSSKPDLDTTAFAVRALADDQSPAAAQSVKAAVSWLLSQQGQDGSFGGGAGSTPNTNSTGLVGTALGGSGETAPAERAATWVFQHQAVDCQQFTPDVHGAIAYDDAGLASAAQGISVKAEDQFRRATAGALPVLAWLPATETENHPVADC